MTPDHRALQGAGQTAGVNVIGFVVFGFVVGIVARLLVPGRQRMGWLTTLLLGVVGSVIGGVAANAVGRGDVLELNLVGSLVAIVSAAVLIIAGERSGIGGRD